MNLRTALLASARLLASCQHAQTAADAPPAAPVSRGEIYAAGATGRGGSLIFGYRAGRSQTGTHVRRAERTAAWGFVISALHNDPRHVLIEETSMLEEGDRAADI